MHSVASASAATGPAFNAALVRIGLEGLDRICWGPFPPVRKDTRLGGGCSHSSSEILSPRKCATTTGAVEFEGFIDSIESMETNRRGVPCRLPKFEYTLSIASASFSATISRV